MGGKNGDLVPFFEEGLEARKYDNLKRDDATKICMLYLPRMSPTLGPGCQHILKDWENLKKRKYIYSESYSSAKQRVISDIRQSVFLEFISIKGGNIFFRILEPGEVLEKKIKKKNKQRIPSKIKRKTEEDLNSMDHSPSSSSGYSSIEGSPANLGTNEENGHAPLPTPTPQLGHDYTAHGYDVSGAPIQNFDQHVVVERPPLRNDASILGNDGHSVCGNEGFSVTNNGSILMNNENPEEVSLDELCKIEEFIVTGTEKHEEIMQEYMECNDDAALLSKLLSETVNHEVRMKLHMESTNTVENTREIEGPSNVVADAVSYEAGMYAPQQQLQNKLESTKAVENKASDIVFPLNFDATMRLDEATKETVSKWPVEELQLLLNNNSKVKCLKCWERIHSMISPNTGCLNLCTGFVQP